MYRRRLVDREKRNARNVERDSLSYNGSGGEVEANTPFPLPGKKINDEVIHRDKLPCCVSDFALMIHRKEQRRKRLRPVTWATAAS